MKPFLTHEHPIRFAHRGSRTLWPENTMVSLQGAVDLGYRYIETDVRASQDDVLVVFHDRELSRLTDGSGLVRKTRWATMSRLDAAHSFSPAGGFPMRGTGLTIPTLLEAMTSFPDLMFNIDIKGPAVARLLPAFLRRHGFEDRVLLAGFLDTRLAVARRLAGPGVATSAASAEAGAFLAAARIGRAIRIPADALQVPVHRGRLEVVNAKLIAAARRVGKQVHAWTVNDPVEMRRLLDLGVDGIVTDRPDLLNEVLGV